MSDIVKDSCVTFEATSINFERTLSKEAYVFKISYMFSIQTVELPGTSLMALKYVSLSQRIECKVTNMLNFQ